MAGLEKRSNMAQLGTYMYVELNKLNTLFPKSLCFLLMSYHLRSNMECQPGD